MNSILKYENWSNKKIKHFHKKLKEQFNFKGNLDHTFLFKKNNEDFTFAPKCEKAKSGKETIASISVFEIMKSLTYCKDLFKAILSGKTIAILPVFGFTNSMHLSIKSISVFLLFFPFPRSKLDR